MLTVPPKLIAIIPPNPRIQPIIFISVSLSFLKNNGTKSTVKNDAQAVIIEVFVPLVKPIPMYVKIYCNPVCTTPSEQTGSISFFESVGGFLFDIHKKRNTINPANIKRIPAKISFEPISDSSISKAE